MEKFNIVFAGQLKDGWTKEQVILELGKLFKVDPVELGKKIFVNSTPISELAPKIKIFFILTLIPCSGVFFSN